MSEPSQIGFGRRLSMKEALILCLGLGHVQSNPGYSKEDIELVKSIAFAALDNVIGRDNEPT